MARLRTNPWAVLLVLCMGFFMILLDTTIVNIAIPSISDTLHASLDDILWVLNAYILVYAVLLITAGRLGDMFGQRTLFAAGMAVFVVASAFCGLAQDTTQLIAARVVQGAGGALLTPQTLAMITSIFPPERRGAAFGIWGAVAGLAAITGPTLGGFLVSNFSWRWIFYVNLPVGIIALAATFLIVPDLRPGRRHGLDPVGVILASLGLLAVVFGLIEGERYNWSVVWNWVTIPMIMGAGGAILVGFIAWERFQREPLVPLSLFTDRNYSLMNFTGAVMSFGMFGLILPFTIYLQAVLGLSALNAGLTIAPSALTALFVAPMAGRLADKVGGKYILLVGLIAFSVGMGLAAWLATPTSTWATFVGPLVLVGIGQGCVFPPQATLALRNVTPRMAGAASGVLNTTRQIGAVIGSAVIGAILENQLVSGLHAQAVVDSTKLPAAFRQRFVDAFTNVASGGLDVGRSQNIGSQIPANLPAQVASQLRALFEDVFSHGFIAAMQATMWVPMAVLLVGALCCVAIEGHKKIAARARVQAEAASDKPSGSPWPGAIRSGLEEQ